MILTPLRSAILLTTVTFLSIVACNKENNNRTNISKHYQSRSHHQGRNCMSCHRSGGEGEGWFTAAGTLYDSLQSSAYPNATVKLYTGPNASGTLKSTIEVDNLGNFYTTEAIDFGTGLYASVEGSNLTMNMPSSITTGQCNSCHGVTTGKIWVK